MSDYIKREDALSLVHHSKFDTEDDKNYVMLLLGKEYGCQSADVVPVVRCKDCKWKADTIGESWCNFHEFTILSDDGFCSYGERRDDEFNICTTR